MRFHIGLSFRLKTLKKFLFPILLGILTYILSSGIGFLNVYASSTNINSYYIYDFPEIDFESLSFGSYNGLQLLEYGDDKQSYYYSIPVISYNFDTSLYVITIYLLPKTNTYINSAYYIKNSSSTSMLYFNFYGDNNDVIKYVRFQTNENSTTINNNLSILNDCLINNSCSSMSGTSVTEYISTGGYFSYLANNNDDFNINIRNINQNLPQNNSAFIYSSPIPIYFVQGTDTSNKVFYKSLKWNNNIITFGDLFPTYKDINSGGNNDDDNNFFQIVDNRFRSLYLNIDKSNLSSLSLNYSYGVYDIDDYDNNLDMIPFWYYGRKNNGTYYSYESINCSNSSSVSSNENVYDFNFNNFTCTSDLTNYDKIYIYTTQKYIDDSIPMFIYGLDVNTSANIYYGDYLGVLYDNFDNLASGFKLLLSTYNDYNPRQVNIISNNDYVGLDLISNSNSIIDVQTSGAWYSSCQHNGICTMKFGNKVYNKNLLIYDDLSYSNASSTNLKLFLEDNIIVSVVNNNIVSYYDNNGNIVSNTITLTYDSVDNVDSYNLNDIFSKINDFIDSLEEDMYNFHDLIDSCYMSLSESVRTLFVILYSLSLTYLLFKVIRK